MTKQVLFCENGQHEWERPSQAGRPPRSCPEHPLLGAQRASSAAKENASAPSLTPEILALLGDEDQRKVLYIERQVNSGKRCDKDVKLLTEVHAEIINRAIRTKDRNALRQFGG